MNYLRNFDERSDDELEDLVAGVDEEVNDGIAADARMWAEFEQPYRTLLVHEMEVSPIDYHDCVNTTVGVVSNCAVGAGVVELRQNSNVGCSDKHRLTIFISIYH